jgi:ABC-type ATPase with predicted acetyltransferase domain
MFIEIKKIVTEYTRISKLKKSHAYSRVRTVAVFRCDHCNSLFERDSGKMDRKRVSNNFQHVCTQCNTKAFAQKIGAENRRFWNIPAGSDVDITKI